MAVVTRQRIALCARVATIPQVAMLDITSLSDGALRLTAAPGISPEEFESIRRLWRNAYAPKPSRSSWAAKLRHVFCEIFRSKRFVQTQTFHFTGTPPRVCPKTGERPASGGSTK